MGKKTGLKRNLVVLYVEDSLVAREKNKKILKLFFKEIIVAKDGEAGLSCYIKDQEKIDLIVTDIEMPKLNGLEMSKEIRAISKNIPIILMTAFNNQEYFMEALALKINKYVLKPVEDTQLIETLKDMADNILQKKIVNKVNDIKELPIVIFDDGKLVNSSKSFNELFVHLSNQEIKNITIFSDNIFKKSNGYLSSISEFIDGEDNKVQVPQVVGKKIFKIYKETIFMNSNCDVFVFKDITFKEYLKIKSDFYTDLIMRDIKKEKHKENIELNIEDISLNIDEKEQDILRKVHIKKAIHAKNFILSMDSFFIQEVEELGDLDIELSIAIDDFEGGDIDAQARVIGYFSRYSYILSEIDEFSDLYVSIDKFVSFLEELNFSELKEDKYTQFFLYLNAMRTDLACWKNNVFINQSAEDIHYLDASLLSNSLQLEMFLSDSEDEVQEDSFELF